MPDINPQKMEQPASGAAPTPGMQARVFTMPERYRHGAEGKMHEPMTKQQAAAAIQVNTPAIPAPKAPPKPSALKKKTSMTKKLLVIGVVVLVVLAVGGYLLVYFTPEPAPQTPPPKTQTTTRPAPVVEEEEEPAPEPEEETTVPTNPFPTATAPGVDTDSDGLTDVEENLVYNTNPKLPDTDSDGFLDGNEVFHGYNPGGTAPGTLLESGVVSEYRGPTVDDGSYPSTHYTLLYPSAWEIESAADDLLPTPVTILPTTGEKIQITLGKTGEPDIDPLAWYEAQGYTQDVEEMTTKNGYTALVSEDRLTVYLFSSADVVVILTMDTGIKSTINYLQTFQMILNSVETL